MAENVRNYNVGGNRVTVEPSSKGIVQSYEKVTVVTPSGDVRSSHCVKGDATHEAHIVGELIKKK